VKGDSRIMTRRVALLLVLMVVVACMVPMMSVPAAGEAPDPWMTKPVLPVLMLTVNEEYKADVARLAQDVELTESEIDALRKIAIREAEVGNTLQRESDRILFDEEASEEAKRQSVASYNSGIVQMMAETDREVRDLLGKRYAAFRRSIREWWAIERARARARREEVTIQADVFSRVVFATQYKGYTDYEIALPDKYLKFANIGRDDTYPDPPYTADLYLNGNWVDGVLVREAGPWNIDDNYWDSDRRMYTDLPLGTPEAEAAYEEGYNDGKDYLGRKNPAGVDLTPDVAADLGLGYLENAWITVYYYDFP